MVSIEESGLGRWARLKKARKDRATRNSVTPDAPEGAGGKTTRGKAAPMAYPVEVSGAYRPWLPPLTADVSDAVPAVGGADQSAVDENAPDDALKGDDLSVEDAAIAEEMGLPDINTLEEESDFSVFIRDGVPDKLRRLALRKLWASNPLFGFRDGMNDYDEDFRVLSDYVYNSAALKRFTEPDREPDDVSEDDAVETEEQVAESTEAQETPDGEPEQGEAPANSDSVTENTDIEPPDDEDLIADDDPELG